MLKRIAIFIVILAITTVILAEDTPLLEPKVVDVEAFDVVGLSCGGPDVMDKIPEAWMGLMARAGEIKAIDNTGAAYGITIMSDDPDNPEGFEYVAGYKVLETDNVPEGMVVVRIDEGKFAVFAHQGPLETIGQTYGMIYGVWIQANGVYDLRNAPQFELYGEKFNPMSEESLVEIYVPVADKAVE